jgi:hypothetical protein
MKLGRRNSEASPLMQLPARSASVVLVTTTGERLPARVVESGPEALLVATLLAGRPLSEGELEGLTLEFATRSGRAHLSGAFSIETAPDVLRIEQLRSVEVLQEREYVRIGAARPVVVYAGRDRMQVPSYTVDLSGGGLLLAGPDTLKVGEEVEFRLTIAPGETPINGRGKVVRSDSRGHRAITFSSISEMDRRRLIHFIFECQRLERQRGLQGDQREGG